ncbi:protein SCAI-like [Branchiostoma floridae]|uniref:Protein SCAI-like n=1 Tax=Branchiostoma floridae TaxID=7739 RepID=A0A9J7LKZ9_BRAFL|nr:protein SCAI-like [Branchiostoma floridae]
MSDEEIPEQERKIVTEFCYLLDKSKQLFNGLRDLPQYGQRQWQAYFGRTFDVYTKLWKFQQQNRQVLDTRYGLKRWQIGEIASKIGQLYYHYYLRTSETNYLHESFSFYSAIRMRAYYSKANKEDKPDLMVKKLRYYARFIVVCLLLNKTHLVRDLVRELSKQIQDYGSTYDPGDQLEWSLVLGEVQAFLDAEPLVILDTESSPVTISQRLQKDTVPPLEPGTEVRLSLQEVIIVGNRKDQVKFSELTVDMFRMLQTLEREPEGLDATEQTTNGAQPEKEGETGENDENIPGKRENPHKYLLYKPTFSQLYTFLASGFKELPPDGVMLVYLSSTGSTGCSKPEDEGAYDYGGVLTNSRKEGEELMKKSKLLKDMHCLHPGDLYPFTRKPLFLVVDSENSEVFKNMPNLFGQPRLCLLSPVAVPTDVVDEIAKGSLFTLFLHCPLTGLLTICKLSDIPIASWERAQRQVGRILEEIARLLMGCKSVDGMYHQFYGDEFLRLLLLRFVFCYCVFRLHRAFKGPAYYPQCHPELPKNEVLEALTVQKQLLDLASTLDIRAMFYEIDESLE